MSNTAIEHNTQPMTAAQVPGLLSALGVIQKFHARVLLVSELKKVVDAAEAMTDKADPDSLFTASADDLFYKLRELIPTEREARVIADAGLALESQRYLNLVDKPSPEQLP